MSLEATEKLITRSERVAFMEVGSTLTRMTKFTAITPAKNAKEYSRQYVDMATETTDVVGYSPSIEYTFDNHTGNTVHAALAKISDDELLGTDTHVDIVTVDTFGTGTLKPAIKRTYAVIPNADSEGTDAMTYSGTFKAVSDIIKGTASSTDGWKTCTFAEASED